MPYPAVLSALASLAVAHPAACDHYVVEPSPEQGMTDAALVRQASHHDASPRSLGTAMAAGSWRIVWAKPDDSEPGVFFFYGRRDAKRFVDVWGGPTSNRVAAFRWASKVGAPAGLARCFADRLVREGP